MRGYYGIGVEGIHKERNVGSIVRSAHAFGASFFFTVTPEVDVRALRSTDTSGAFSHLPYYEYNSVEGMSLPSQCQLVGIEFIEESVDLPSFRHPVQAAYVLGPEMGSLSPELVEKCAHVIKIPTKFCVNVGIAGALVMYDRMISMGRFPKRPVVPGGPIEPVPPHKHGCRRKSRRDSK